MSIYNQHIPIEMVFDAIKTYFDKATEDYYVAKGQQDEQKAQVAASVKMSLANLKMEIVDKVVDDSNKRALAISNAMSTSYSFSPSVNDEDKSKL